MDLIKLYYSNTDIKPRVLLGHFLRFLGFYVESITSEKNLREDVDSLVDIYIIGNDFAESNRKLLDSIEEEKTILILKEGWASLDESVKKIMYSEVSESQFLCELIDDISDIIYDAGKEFNCLFEDLKQWELVAKQVAQRYSNNQILKSSLFTRCFYKQEDLYHWAMHRYLKFIRQIEGVEEKLYDTDALKYVLLYSKYEVNLICKMNSFKPRFDAQNMLVECEELLCKYDKNEELHILKADILYELCEEYLDACDSYADIDIVHCSYANMKCGKIVKEYLGEYDKAIQILEKAIQKQEKYYQAWYQMADCYERMGEFKKAIEKFSCIIDGLKEKYDRHILSPLELEYLYKSIMRIAIIYKLRFVDYTSANQYNNLAEKIRNDNAIGGYVDLLWGTDGKFDELIEKIYETIEEHVNIKLEEIY